MQRTIEVTFILKFDDARPKEERESTEQFLDNIAYGIDNQMRHRPNWEPTQIATWKE